MRLKQPLHLLVDGADKLGKTTVIQLLSRVLSLPVIKMPDSKGFIDDGSIERASRFFNEILTQFQEYDFIMDRGYPSSLVYSAIFGRDYDLKYLRQVEGVLKPKVFILAGRQQTLDDIKEVNENWSKINQQYRKLAEANGYVLIEVDGLSPTEVCNRILENL